MGFGNFAFFAGVEADPLLSQLILPGASVDAEAAAGAQFIFGDGGFFLDWVGVCSTLIVCAWYSGSFNDQTQYSPMHVNSLSSIISRNVL